MAAAACHPERKHHAKGLCYACYLRDWYAANPEKHGQYARKHRDNHPEARGDYYRANKDRIAVRNKARYDTDPEVRLRRLAAKYGMTMAERAAMLADPCAICDGTATDIDHDHDTGRVRAGLCNACNSAIGLLRDDPELAARAAEYLASHRPLLRIA